MELNIKAPMNNIKTKTSRYGWRGGLKFWAGNVYLTKVADSQFETDFVYEIDNWDVLIIVDACRHDLFTEVDDEYDCIDETESRTSVASCTWKWLPELIDRADKEDLSNTAYITGNPQSQNFVSGEFGYVDEVWQYAWDDSSGTVLPRPVTDRAISHWRSEDACERMIVHYLPPHVPFVNSDRSPELSQNNFRDSDTEVYDDWVLAARGERDVDAVWADYRANLRLVLNDVSILSENVDANEMRITSDHGNAVGEYGIYGHPDLPLHELREVPWAKVTANDEETHQPAEYDREGESDIEEKLAALGYR
jgi:hypothetical protein